MDWSKQTPDATIAAQIAEKVSGDDSIRTVITSGTDHAIITWKNRRRIWQYWHRDEDARWHLVGEHGSATAAKTQADQQAETAASVAHVRSLDSGTALTVIAEWDSLENLYHSNRPMKVACSSPFTAEVISGVFRRLGCRVSAEVA